MVSNSEVDIGFNVTQNLPGMTSTCLTTWSKPLHAKKKKKCFNQDTWM